jgi:APA family basic amino acid/polyamine antiporter
MAILIGILFYMIIIAAVAFVAPWHNLTGEKFMTAAAFQQAVGSRGIVNLILAAALLSLVKCFNGNFIAASRMVFALGRRGLIHQRAGDIHPQHQTPSIAVLCIGIATAACMLLGDAILVPVTEVGSVASAIGWTATCAAYLALSRTAKLPGFAKLSAAEFAAALIGLAVAAIMFLMKVVPAIPGHFTLNEWVAMAVWIAFGAIAHRRARTA